MASKALWLDFEFSGVDALQAELQATPKQVRAALSRAAGRTATTLRKRAARGLATELQLATVAHLRRRLKAGRIRGVSARGERFAGGAQLWFGLNPMPVGWFKGRPVKTARGARHRGREFEGAFVARGKAAGRKKLSIFRRKGDKRLPIYEETIPVEDPMQVYLEDEVLVHASEIFWTNFERDLRARVRFNLGAR
jgi:hypothetical protein